jgi:hypothetical protein
VNLPSRTYNMTVNHKRRNLSTTRGHPAHFGNKMPVLFDELLTGICNGKIQDDVEFELIEYNASGEAVSVKYRGVWVLVDNGYLNWSIMVPPLKRAITTWEIRWSQWLESMRKDVECTCGTLKGWFVF